eukprot:TRINITY_DN840_c0_g1_i1.p1 TRINITY_DN840_c0_g1~~TRINITY_DN840_c0_g1_i1.p1  ORF type:complete len:1486 (-),score=419.48 TRINITY_DN840_c0_g1_i1:95-4552(-)
MAFRLAKVVNRLSDGDTTLSNVCLGEASLSTSDAAALGVALRGNKRVKHVSLRNNQLGDVGILSFVVSLETGLRNLVTLDLRDNSLGPDAAIAVGELMVTSPRLSQIHLSQNMIDATGAIVIAAALSAKCDMLQLLHIANNTLGPNGASTIAESFQHNSSLTELDIGGNSIGDDGAIAILKAVAKNKHLPLYRLDMQLNDLGSGVVKIIDPIFQETAISHLNLSFNRLGDEGARAVASILPRTPFLHALLLEGNGITFEGANLLANALIHNKSLAALSLANNRIENKGAIAFARVLEVNNTLSTLLLSGNPIEPQYARLLFAACRDNYSLVKLDVDTDVGFEELSRLSTNCLAIQLGRSLRTPAELTAYLKHFKENPTAAAPSFLSPRAQRSSSFVVSPRSVSSPQPSSSYDDSSVVLDLRSCDCLSTIPPSLLSLTHLTELIIFGCGLEEIPPEIAVFTHLKTLVVRKNFLSSLPPAIGQLRSLTYLDVSHNTLMSLPTTLGHLSALEEFDLRSNQLAALPSDIGKLTRLTRLMLSRNALDFLPHQLSALSRLKTLDLAENPFNGIPHQTLVHGTLDQNSLPKLFGFLREIGKGGAERYSRVRLMFVGEGAVGKTSLIEVMRKRQMKEQKNEDKFTLTSSGGTGAGGKVKGGEAIRDGKSKTNEPPKTVATDGIDITSLSLRVAGSGLDKERQLDDVAAITFDCWDYAGQDLYYVTHNFFMSDSGVYIVVFNLVEDDYSKVEYWIKSVQTRVDEPHILVVGTHMDDKRCTREYVDDVMHGLKERFTRRNGFARILDFIAVSCKNLKGIDQLTKVLITIAHTKKLIGQEFPRSYLELERQLMAARNTQDLPMSWHDFVNVAIGCNIDKAAVADVTKFFHEIGIICHFHHKKSGLSNLVFLNPQFLTDVMATLISLRNNYSRGEIKEEQLPMIWKAYPEELYPHLLALLEMFEIAFPLPDSDVLLIPSLLPDDVPSSYKVNWEDDAPPEPGTTRFGRIYRFSFLPLGFFSRLLVRVRHIPEITASSYWKNGMVVQRGKESGALRYNPDTYEVQIKVHGTNDGSLLHLLVSTVDTLIEGWYRVKTEILIPYRPASGHSKADACEVRWDTCAVALMKGKSEVDVRGELVPISQIAPDVGFADLGDCISLYDDLELGKEIGRGSFGTIFLATWRDEEVAVKRLDVDVGGGGEEADPFAGGDETLVEMFIDFQQEVRMMMMLVHPNIVELKSIILQPLCMVMECIPCGNLKQLLEKVKEKNGGQGCALPWPMRLRIALDVAKGMEKMHSFRPPVMHRDLRSPNVLLSSLDVSAPIVAKIADFGLARMSSTLLTRADLNPCWLAPEIMKGEEHSSKSDVYSYGIILWEVLTCDFPFREYEGKFRNHFEFQNLVKEGLRPSFPSGNVPDADSDTPATKAMTADGETTDMRGSAGLAGGDPSGQNNPAMFEAYAELIKECWDGDPDMRPAFDEIVVRAEAMYASLLSPNVNAE